MKIMMSSNANLVDVLDIQNQTPLFSACKYDAIKAMELLIDAFGADVNKQNKFGNTVLHYAGEF